MRSIYELLAGISATQHRQGNRLEEIAAAQAEQGNRLEEIAATQVEQRAKLDTIIELLRGPDSSGGQLR